MQKIFFLSGNYPPNTGGEFYNCQIYEYLREKEKNIEYVNLHKLRFILKLKFIPIIGDIFISLLLAILLLRCRGLLIVDNYFSYYLIFTKIINKLFHGKLVLIVHHSDRYQDNKQKSIFSIIDYFNQIKEKISLFLADKIVTVSEYTKKEIIALGVNSEIIEILPPGLDRQKLEYKSDLVNTETIHETYSSEDSCENNSNKISKNHPIQILCVGHCIPRKGIIHLIEACDRIINQQGKSRNSDFTLHIVGKTDKDKRYYTKVKHLIEKFKLQEYICLHERVNQQDLNKLYSSSDIFILPSLKEGFGIVFLEAMYYSLPIITTNISAIPELVKNRDNGLLVPPANAKFLAEAILLLIDNSQLRITMGQQGKKIVDKYYFWEQTNSKFLSIVDKLYLT